MSLKDLKAELTELGYGTKQVKEHLEVYDRLEGIRFDLQEAGEYLQIRTTLLPVNQLEKYPHRAAMDEFVMRLHTRPLGCRLATAVNGEVILVEDLYPDHQDVDHIDNVFSKVHIFTFTFLEVLKKVGRTGKIPSVAEIDKLIKDCQAEEQVIEDDETLFDVDEDFDDPLEVDDEDFAY